MKNQRFFVLIFVFLLAFKLDSLSQELDMNALKGNLTSSLSSEGFLSNINAKKNGRGIQSKNLRTKSNWDFNNFSLQFEKDSLIWILVDSAGDSYQIKYPNDVTLFYGKDKKELQDELLEKIRSSNHDYQPSGCEDAKGEILHQVEDEKDSLFKQQHFITPDSKRIYAPELPIESLVNTFMFPGDCHLTPIVLMDIHSYGNPPQAIGIFPGALSKTILTEDWKVWSSIESTKILFLFEHPFLSFQHMLFLEFSEETAGWKGDFYSFIPNSNFGDLFKDYKSNQFQLKLKVE